MSSSLPSIVAGPATQLGLKPRDDLRDPGWTFWELRTLNRHRVVGLVTEHRQFRDARDLETEIRGVVSRHFKCAWWRGMAYGVVADGPAISLNAEALEGWSTFAKTPRARSSGSSWRPVMPGRPWACTPGWRRT